MRVVALFLLVAVRGLCAVQFETDVAPVLASRCLECHSGEKAKGGLDLSSHAGALKGGKSGEALAPGKPEESYLLERVESGEMPPASRGQSQKLPAAEIAVLREWIGGGATWPEGRVLGMYERTSKVRGGLDWWSLQPVKRPVLSDGDGGNPIDAFVERRLKAEGMEPAPIAGRRTLVRRAYFDLIGLPPTAEQIEDFEQDRSPGAWESLVDGLLASEHYGERWARHWLDVVRFAETSGYERDQLKPNIWRYRDWVIQALNGDMPYDRFVTLQLAGDEVPDRDESTVIATGMIRAGTWNDEPNDPADYVYERLQDMVHVTSSAFLGLTVKCARCHDHKFDPIHQEDYYRVAAVFWPGYIGQANLGGPNQEELGYDVFGWTDRSVDVEPIRLLVKGERGHPAEVVEPGHLSLVPALARPFEPAPAGSRTTRRRLQFAEWIADPRNPLTPRVLVNRVWLHHFGEGLVRSPDNFGFKGEVPTHPELLDWLASEFVKPELGGKPWSIKHLHKLILMSRAYRRASVHPREAEYSEKDFLNRWLWKSNRRRLEAEVLRDAMLATSGELNRSMGGPSFYPQMSEEALEGLSRKGGDWKESPRDERMRRSISMMTKRSRILPLMTAFDFSDTTLPCGQRDVTTVAPQALALLNNRFVHERSAALARRVRRSSEPTRRAQVQSAWSLALGRVPDAEELESALAHLDAQALHFTGNTGGRQVADEWEVGDPELLALASLCHVLLNANEFIYVD